MKVEKESGGIRNAESSGLFERNLRREMGQGRVATLVKGEASDKM